MTHGPRYRVKPRRQREQRTDYRRRLALLKSRKTRIVVRKSIQQIIVQFVQYQADGDQVIASAVSSELRHMKWKYSLANTPAAYLTGLLAGQRAVAKGIEEGVLDIGRGAPSKGSKMFAALQGILDAGVDCPHDDGKLPSEDRIKGAHLQKEVSAQFETVKKTITEAK